METAGYINMTWRGLLHRAEEEVSGRGGQKPNAVNAVCVACDALLKAGVGEVDGPAAGVLMCCILDADEIASDTHVKLTLWKGLISILKKIHPLLSTETSCRLLGVLDSYVSGGVKSLLRVKSESCGRLQDPAALNTLLDILLFFLQRFGVALLYLSHFLTSAQPPLASYLRTLLVCRGAVRGMDAARTVVDQVFLRVLFSQSNVANSEQLRGIFYRQLDSEMFPARNESADFNCSICVGYVQLWCLAISHKNALPRAQQDMAAIGIRTALRSLSALCLGYPGEVCDTTISTLCRQLGEVCAARVESGDLALPIHVIVACCSPDRCISALALAVLRAALKASPLSASVLSHLCASIISSPRAVDPYLSHLTCVLHTLLLYGSNDDNIVLVKAIESAALDSSRASVVSLLCEYLISKLPQSTNRSTTWRSKIISLCIKSCKNNHNSSLLGITKRKGNDFDDSLLPIAEAYARALGERSTLFLPVSFVAEDGIGSSDKVFRQSVMSSLNRYIPNLERLEQVLAAEGSVDNISHLQIRRCGIFSRFVELCKDDPIKIVSNDEVSFAVRMFADVVAGFQLMQNTIEPSARILELCSTCYYFACNAFLNTGTSFMSYQHGNRAELARFQCLGGFCKMICKAMFELDGIAARRDSQLALRLLCAQCWVILLRAIVGFAATLSPLLKDPFVHCFLSEEMLPLVAARAKQLPHSTPDNGVSQYLMDFCLRHFVDRHKPNL